MPAEQTGGIEPQDIEQPSAGLVAQLRESLGLLQVAFDASGEAMLILDGDRTIRWANQKAADLWGNGFTPLLTGKPFASLVPLQQLDGQGLPAEAPNHPLQLMQRGDGERRYRIASPIHAPGDDDNQPPQLVRWKRIQGMRGAFVLLIVRDLGPMESALLEQRRFVNRLAHELRTPLAILSGCLHRLGRTSSLPDQQQQRLNHAQEEAGRMGDLLDKLLLLSELDTDQYDWRFEATSLEDVLQGWIEGLPEVEKTGISLNLGNQNPMLMLDRDALEQVLNNLLHNSMRFSDHTSPVQITAQREGSHLELLFTDWGPGISQANDPSEAFTRFTRLEEHRDPCRSEGCGLGLPVVRSLMEGMGGQAFCQPNRDPTGLLQPGTVVVLRLPLPITPTMEGDAGADPATGRTDRA